MAALGSKSSQEISELLDEYGIKHGPVVDSTRGLYEKKLKEAMAKDTPVKKPSDRTYYREEQTEVTYVHRRVPLKSEALVDSGRSYTSTADYREPEDESWDQRRSYTSTTKYGEPEVESWDRGRSYTSTKSQEPEGEDGDRLYQAETAHRYTSRSQPPVRSPSAPLKDSSQPGRLIPLWFQFLVFLVVAAFLYYVFTSMEVNDGNPFKQVA
ncbi:emerin (Emery-Dreifuss muscular dystrophy) isoform X2 [Conger conger]|uniref:emerin (Emery-Dreifuss muscular dystrophy) isoform X2 n=1 Tax=Conger conger TaxID=82655 RepID=UPI002A5AEAFE|nr:emerin (Emery-Dreifuss muscular dystrophy) isoform X2 [Conger conger]